MVEKQNQHLPPNSHSEVKASSADAAPGEPSKPKSSQLRTGALAFAMVAGALGFGANLLSIQDHACRIPLGQPAVSDMCGGWGFGNVPSKAERLAWLSRKTGDCGELREFAGREGFYQDSATAMLSARVTKLGSNYEPNWRQVSGYVRASDKPFESLSLAQADAIRRAKADAEMLLCAPQQSERLLGITVAEKQFDCRAHAWGGFVCGFDFSANCEIEVRTNVEICE